MVDRGPSLGSWLPWQLNGIPRLRCRGANRAVKVGTTPLSNGLDTAVAFTMASKWLNGRNRSYLQSHLLGMEQTPHVNLLHFTLRV